MINLEDLEGFKSLEEINKELKKRANAHNSAAKKDFEGLSPEQMAQLEYNFPSGASPLTMNELKENQLEKCPLLMQVRFLIDNMKGGKELKLTKTGALSGKLVKEIYSLGHLKNQMIEEGISKLNKESDAMEISITRILLEMSSLAKKRNGKLSLTKKGEKHADDGNVILREILTVLLKKFNWAYYDRYESESIGRVNPAFSLLLLKKYGSDKRAAEFYSQKYFKAFPWFAEGGGNLYQCYELRTFERYFHFMGFVQVEQKHFLGPVNLKKTVFFDQLFSI